MNECKSHMISGSSGIKKTFGNDNIYLMPNNTNNFPSNTLNIISQKKLILRGEIKLYLKIQNTSG